MKTGFPHHTKLFLVFPRWFLGIFAVALIVFLVPCSEIRAEDNDLQKANQQFANPISRATLFIIENDTLSANGNITNSDRYANLTVIEPIIPISLGNTGWTMVNRPIVPFVIDAEIPGAATGGGPEIGDTSEFSFDKKSGIGDFTFFSAFSPETGSRFNFGIGPIFRFPTATKDALGAEKWSAGPMAVALYSADTWTVGFLNQNLFSFAGKDSRKDVRASTLQYFAFYNFTPQWGVGMAPIIKYNWEAGSDEKLSFPLGLGITYTFKAGKIPMRILVEYQNYVVSPDTLGLEQNFRIAWASFLPKLFD